MADPDFMLKTIEGRVDEIVHCISCNQGCVERLFMTSEGASCIFNSACGYEADVKVEPAVDKKKILVVGAGPGGLEASHMVVIET